MAIFQARKSVLLDLYTSDDSHDGKSLVAYRKGDFKLISGSYKDPNWYYEPTEDHVKSSDTGLRPRIIGTHCMKASKKLLRTIKDKSFRKLCTVHGLGIWRRAL